MMTNPRYVSMAADFIWSTGLIGQFQEHGFTGVGGQKTGEGCRVQHNPMSLIFKEGVGGEIDQIDQYDFIFGWSI